MPELGTYGSLGGMARESCLYPEADCKNCAAFVHVAIAPLLHKTHPVFAAAELSVSLLLLMENK